ncbi:MAG: 16S rRNA (guanine(966)-N(2))-methyltransferase RsmD [Deltaproteobacteria bacterium]|nr:16S rRNA (guanine(966)-N(2))-methyltransferase RsmD [Deltaproteobacteria bacterium]
MRITGGTFRGRKITVPKGLAIRPTADLVREAIFNIIGHDLSGCFFLDLFAGTGVLSLEALSRGCEAAVVVDFSPRALESIRRNAASLDLTDRVRIIRHDLRKGLGPLAGLGMTFQLVFIDPPYDSGLLVPTLERLDASVLLQPSCLVIAEHAAKSEAMPAFRRLTQWTQRSYGQSRITMFQYRHAEDYPGADKGPFSQ